MSVTIKVNGSANSLVHKTSNHIATCTVPDVCKTPSPGGPVPIPYPVIVSMSSDLANGSTTVKADGGNMIAIKGCDFSRCTGDEAGTAGGVKSSTFGKEAKFILYSFDVKIDGQNACRLMDKMTMNHENTVCLGGALGPTVVVTPAIPGPPGDCTQEVYGPLNDDVQNSKKEVAGAGGACRDGDSPKVLKTKGQAWLNQATARSKRDGKCFRGGDPGHQEAQASAWSHVARCQKMLK